MDQMIEEKLVELKKYVRDIEYLNSAVSVLYWDMRVGIPKKGVENRGEVLGYLSNELYKQKTSPTIKEFIDFFEKAEGLDKVTEAMLENIKKEYERTKKIPQERYREFVILQSKSEVKWEEAKEKADFSIFMPYLEKIIEFEKEFVNYWGYERNKYDTLLDFYEPGMTVEKLDKVFGDLRDAIVELLKKINSSKADIDLKLLNGVYLKADQEKLGLEALKLIGYDFDAGRLDESVHPFTIELGPGDIRITTRYNEGDFMESLYGCIHEGGHAIYEQNISEELRGTLLGTGVSMGIHESQSRFYENILGRSKGFLSYFYPHIVKTYPKFEHVPFEKFYKAINTVKPSLIRTEADELTYSLHVIIRYEIEKMIFNDEISVAELPKVWNEKYKEYLGIEPENDSVGVLQDMHWSDGSFGYFPSYALGNLYNAQFYNKMKEEIEDLEGRIEKGELSCIKDWLGEKIHRHGSVYKPQELIVGITGEELNAKYFIEYLNKKYSEIYEL